MDTKISAADESGISIVTERESGIKLGTIRKVVDRTPVMTNDRGYYYSIGHTQRTVYRAFSWAPGARGLGKIADFTRRADAVAAIVRAWS